MKLVPVALAAALAACAPTPPPGGPMDGRTAAASSPRQCFFASNVNSYRETADQSAVHLRVGVNEIWRLGFAGSCPGIEWSRGRIALVQRGGSSICSGFDADVVVDDNGINRRCLVRDVRRLSEAEVAAVPERERP